MDSVVASCMCSSSRQSHSVSVHAEAADVSGVMFSLYVPEIVSRRCTPSQNERSSCNRHVERRAQQGNL